MKIYNNCILYHIVYYIIVSWSLNVDYCCMRVLFKQFIDHDIISTSKAAFDCCNPEIKWAISLLIFNSDNFHFRTWQPGTFVGVFPSRSHPTTPSLPSLVELVLTSLDLMSIVDKGEHLCCCSIFCFASLSSDQLSIDVQPKLRIVVAEAASLVCLFLRSGSWGEQFNKQTAFIDASAVYGCHEVGTTCKAAMNLSSSRID